MADFYKDADGGSDASDGTTWANAKLTDELTKLKADNAK